MADRAREDRSDREDRARGGGPLGRGGRGGVLTGRAVAAVLAALVVASGCPKKHAPPPTPEPAQPPLAESPLPPSGTPHFEIGPITPRKSDDGGEWLVESSVRNTGTRTSRDIRVWVEGLDNNGARLARTEISPEQQEVPPGGAASFVARLPGNPAISTFHVEAVGR